MSMVLIEFFCMKTDVDSEVWSCGGGNDKIKEVLEMKACSQRPAGGSKSSAAWAAAY